MKGEKIAYVCGTTYDEDLDPLNGGAENVYMSVSALKRGESCWEECGIVKVKIMKEKWAVRPKREKETK